MQIALRSQMIAGATALVGATAIALTPIAPAASLPALNSSQAAVRLALFYNPITQILATGDLAIKYLTSPYFVTGDFGGASNWGYDIQDGQVISDFINDLLPESFVAGQYLPKITAVGIVPNFLQEPFPVGTQLASNWIGYLGTAARTASTALGYLSEALWAPVITTVYIAQAVLNGAISTIPTLIQFGISTVVGGVYNSINQVVSGVQTLLGSVAAKASALATNLSAALPQAIQVIQGQVAALQTSVMNNIANITTAAASQDPETIWNAAVKSLLGPTGIPGSLLNLTLGAGVTLAPTVANPTGWVPSVRATIQTLGQSVAGALGTAPGFIVGSTSAVRSAAATKKVAAPTATVAASETGAASSDTTAAPAKVTAKVGRHAARAAAK